MAIPLPASSAYAPSPDWRDLPVDSGVFTSPSNAFPDIPPGPCEGCEHRARCAAELLACMSFADFVRRGEESPLSMPRRDVFVRLFGQG